MGDLISAVTSGIGDVFSGLFNDVSNIGSDIGSLFGSGASAAPINLYSADAIPSTVAGDAEAIGSQGLAGETPGGFGDFGPPNLATATGTGIGFNGSLPSSLAGIVSQIPSAPVSLTAGLSSGGAATPSSASGLISSAPTGGTASLPPGGTPISSAAPTGIDLGAPATSEGASALGANLTPQQETQVGNILSGNTSPIGAAAASGTGGGAPSSAGGILGEVKPYLPLLSGLGALAASAFARPAIPGAGSTLTPSGTSTGQQVQSAQQEQQIAQQETQLAGQQAALVPQEQAIAQAQTAAANPLIATGEAQVEAAAAGQLTPAQATYVQQSLTDAQNQIKATYANLGLSGSTMETQDLNAAVNQAQSLTASLLLQNQQAGLSTASQGQSGLSSAGSTISGEGSTLGQATSSEGSAASAEGGAASIYGNIAGYQLSADQGLQNALASLAQGSGIGSGIAIGQALA